MTNLIFKNIFDTTVKYSYGLSISGIWVNLGGCFSREGIDISIKESEENRIKLCKAGTQEIFTSSISEQLQLIEDNWPPYGSEKEEHDLDDFGSL